MQKLGLAVPTMYPLNEVIRVTAEITSLYVSVGAS